MVLNGLLPPRRSSGGGVSDHGLLTGLADDDHTQYLLVDGTRAMTGALRIPGLTLVGTTSPLTLNASVGTSGQVLTSAGAGATPTWTTPTTGTVTSVGLTVPNILSVGGSPVIGAGTLAVSLANQNANVLFAGPSSGGAATPTFRSLVAADLGTTLNVQLGSIGIGATPLTGPLLSVPVAPTASANYGLISLGSGAFDGSTSGFFVGNSNGTHIAINAASGYTGRMADFQVAGVRMFGVGRPTQASSASATLNAIDVPSFTVTVTGATNITTAAGFNYFRVGIPTYTAASAVVVTNAGTAVFEGAPVGAGSLTITNPYTLWVQAGATRLDGRQVNTVNGAASAPGLLLSGAPFAGTGTTSFPQLYINDTTATASTTLSTAGTYLGVNGHGSADLINLMVDGVSKLRMLSSGFVGVGLGATSPTDYLHILNSGSGAGGLTISSTAGTPLIALSADTSSKPASFNFFDGSTAYGGMLLDRSTSVITGTTRNDLVVFANSTSALHFATNSTIRATFSASGAALRLGKANNASPQSFTLTIGESSRSGTDSNVAGASGTLQPGAGTGTGATTPLILKAPIQVASGSGAQTYTEFMRGQAVGTAIGLSFYGVAAVARQVLATGAGATADNIITALQNLGLVSQT